MGGALRPLIRRSIRSRRRRLRPCRKRVAQVKIPQPIIGKLQELLENTTFPTEEALLLAAMQPAFNGYAITQQVLDRSGSHVLNERVFCRITFDPDDGPGVRQKDGDMRVDTAYWSDDELQTFWEAAKSRREGKAGTQSDMSNIIWQMLPALQPGADPHSLNTTFSNLADHALQAYRKLAHYEHKKTFATRPGWTCIREQRRGILLSECE